MGLRSPCSATFTVDLGPDPGSWHARSRVGYRLLPNETRLTRRLFRSAIGLALVHRLAPRRWAHRAAVPAERCMLARMESAAPPASATEPLEELSDTERAVYGAVTLLELRTFLDAWARDRRGSAIADVRFRAGRIDPVWGVGLQDGRAVVIKAHRTPVDLDAAQATIDAQRALAAAGFPCPVPLSGPDEVKGRVLTAETLIVGAMPNGRKPAIRRLPIQQPQPSDC